MSVTAKEHYYLSQTQGCAVYNYRVPTRDFHRVRYLMLSKEKVKRKKSILPHITFTVQEPAALAGFFVRGQASLHGLRRAKSQSSVSHFALYLFPVSALAKSAAGGPVGRRALKELIGKGPQLRWSAKLSSEESRTSFGPILTSSGYNQLLNNILCL